MKNTLAAWLALLVGPLGLHRFYLHGPGDWIGWLHPIPTALGIYGLQRVQAYGLDDTLSWVLIPLLGFNIAQCALWAIIHGLMPPERWNAKFNPGMPPDSAPGHTQWLTIGAIVLSLLLGATALMASLVYSLQRYFEYQVEEGRKISR
jgi:hypothetical protein